MSRFKDILADILRGVANHEEKYYLDDRYLRFGLIQREINTAHEEQIKHENALLQDRIRELEEFKQEALELMSKSMDLEHGYEALKNKWGIE